MHRITVKTDIQLVIKNYIFLQQMKTNLPKRKLSIFFSTCQSHSFSLTNMKELVSQNKQETRAMGRLQKLPKCIPLVNL